MSYIDIATLQARFGKQALQDAAFQEDDELLANTEPTERLQDAIDVAEEEADGYLSGRYQLPLSSVPLTLKKYVADMAFANLFQGGNREVPETVTTRRNAAIGWLKDVAAGRVLLGGAAPPPTTGSGAPVVAATTNNRPFSAAVMERY